jgi:uncharacterized membrane protein YebE (DUF533 family)
VHEGPFSYEELAMETPLIILIVLLSGAICACGGYWFYRAAQERRQHAGAPQHAQQTTQRSARNRAWDHAVRAARNRNR